MNDKEPKKIICHLWNAEKLSKDDLLKSFDVVEVVEQESHFSRKIIKCTQCGQVYLYQFYEEVDWDGGNDEQWYQWIPVKNIEQVHELCTKSVLELLPLSCIRIDFSKEMKNPKGPYKFELATR